jgi:hypothetical protein|tara:strand:- start:1731 stop:2012 length:282 start_codon:yes stop_codon:yes gene_type:complete
MKEYSDLELNKMIAELIKWDFDFSLPRDMFFGWKYIGPLMVKYKVGIAYALKDSDSSVGICEIKDNRYSTVFKSESEIPRAIIMCILKSKNII